MAPSSQACIPLLDKQFGAVSFKTLMFTITTICLSSSCSLMPLFAWLPYGPSHQSLSWASPCSPETWSFHLLALSMTLHVQSWQGTFLPPSNNQMPHSLLNLMAALTTKFDDALSHIRKAADPLFCSKIHDIVSSFGFLLRCNWQFPSWQRHYSALWIYFYYCYIPDKS